MRSTLVVGTIVLALGATAAWAKTAHRIAVPPPAAVFVAPTGSDSNTCRSRNAPCATFARAYAIARPGQIVEVAAGTYPAQTVLAVQGKRAPNVVFRPSIGGRVVLGGLSFGEDNPALGPDFITVRGMEMAYLTTEPGAGNQRGIFVGPGSSRITLESMDAGNVHLWFADRVTIRGGDYGPCHAVWGHPNVCGNTKLDVSTNVTVDGATFHDYRFDETCFTAGADCHWECMYVNGGVNVTIKNSKFRDCAVFDIFTTVSGPDAAQLGHRNLTIENNWFDTPWREGSGAIRARPSGVSLAWCQNSPQGYENVVVRFNSFHATTGIELDLNAACVWRNVRIVGNLLMYPGPCDPRVTYAYNVWSTSWRRGKCAATDRIGGRTFPYANAASGAAFDFRLTRRRTTIADNLVPASVPGGCPRTDIERQRRPLNKRCDAGADERLRPRPRR